MVAKKQQFDEGVVVPINLGQDRRIYRRSYTVLSGQVANSADQWLNCIVLDLSANGAKVRFEEPVMSDDIERIKLAGAVSFDVEVAWTNGIFAGLIFLDPPSKVAGVLAGVLPDACLEF